MFFSVSRTSRWLFTRLRDQHFILLTIFITANLSVLGLSGCSYFKSSSELLDSGINNYKNGEKKKAYKDLEAACSKDNTKACVLLKTILRREKLENTNQYKNLLKACSRRGVPDCVANEIFKEWLDEVSKLKKRNDHGVPTSYEELAVFKSLLKKIVSLDPKKISSAELLLSVLNIELTFDDDIIRSSISLCEELATRPGRLVVVAGARCLSTAYSKTDVARSTLWTERAALSGDVESMRNMIYILHLGDKGRVEDRDMSKAWLVVCAAHGDGKCKEMMGEFKDLIPERILELARQLELRISNEKGAPDEIRCTNEICEAFIIR